MGYIFQLVGIEKSNQQRIKLEFRQIDKILEILTLNVNISI